MGQWKCHSVKLQTTRELFARAAAAHMGDRPVYSIWNSNEKQPRKSPRTAPIICTAQKLVMRVLSTGESPTHSRGASLTTAVYSSAFTFAYIYMWFSIFARRFFELTARGISPAAGVRNTPSTQHAARLIYVYTLVSRIIYTFARTTVTFEHTTSCAVRAPRIGNANVNKATEKSYKTHTLRLFFCLFSARASAPLLSLPPFLAHGVYFSPSEVYFVLLARLQINRPTRLFWRSW